MKYALIGCGRIARNHIKAALENKLDIVAVCDLVPQQMETLLEEAGLGGAASIRRYTSHTELLANETPQLVSIATDSGSHARIALDCMDAGRHLIIEKPIALSMADADAIVAKGREKGLVVSACHQNRFNLAVQTLRRALEEGRFGALSHGTVHVRWNRGQSYYTQAPWRGTWSKDGGCLMNQSIHGIDLLRWMLGDEIDSVCGFTARQNHPYIQAEDVGVAVVRFKNGALATIEGTTNVYPKNLEETLYLFGATGTAKLGGKSTNRIDVWDFADTRPEDGQAKALVEETVNVYGNGHIALWADVIDAIDTGRAPYVDAAAGRRALELVLAVYQSAKTGREVRLPLVDCSSTDFEDLF